MSDRTPERVLVIGDDMRIFLAVVRSLGRAGKEVHAAPFNWRSPALKSRYVAKIHYLPRYSDDPTGWLTSILDAQGVYSFNLIIPCCDRAILPLHRHRGDLDGIPLAIPPHDAMELLFDKECTKKLCQELEVPVMAGARIDGDQTAQHLVHRYGLPLVLKPRRSYWIDQLDSWGKVWIVDTMPQLQEVLDQLQDRSRYLAEAFFVGVGVGVSVLAHEGQILHAFQHRRLREGRGGSSSYRISEAVNAELYQACSKICAHTNLTGVCMFEFRYNLKRRNWVLLETNARFWGSMPLPLSLGIDFPLFLYDLLVHKVRHQQLQYSVGIRSRNVVLDGLNLITSLRGAKPSQFHRWLFDVADFAVQPARWLTNRERSDSFVLDDLAPALNECVVLFQSIGQKLVRTRKTRLNRRGSERITSLDSNIAGT